MNSANLRYVGHDLRDVMCRVDLTPDLRITRVGTVSGVIGDVSVRQRKVRSGKLTAGDDLLADVGHDARIATTFTAAYD